MPDVKDKKRRLVKVEKSVKPSEINQNINLNEKDKKAAEFLKKHPVPKKFLSQ